MSDRTQGSVRTGARGDEGSRGPDQQAGGTPPVSETQSIATSSGMRAQAPAGNGPVGAQAAGAQAAGVQPAGMQAAAGRPTSPVGAAAPAVAPGSAQRPAKAAAAGKPKGKAAGRGPRRARLQLRHIDTWSAFKISLVLSIALFFIWMVAIGILYGVLSGLGVFQTLNDLFGQLGSASGSSKASSNVITPGIVLGGAAVIGAINVILMTALCTVGTFIYNMCADLVGGLEVTLSERD